MNKKPRPPLRYLSPWHRATRGLQEHLRGRAAACDVPPGEAHLVSYLGSYAPVAVGVLVDVFGLNRSTLTGMLDRLERAGLAVRSINPDDRRSFLVDLTPAGHAAATRMRAELETLEAALDAALSPSDRAAFGRIVDAVARITQPTATGTTGRTAEESET